MHNYIQTYHHRYKAIQIDTGTPRDDWHQNAKRRHDSGRTVQYPIFNIHNNNNNIIITVI